MSLRIHDQSASMRALISGNAASGAMSRSLERLSSGLRINRASDDAASLSISESLRSQVRGRHQALNNSQDFVSLVQTADGALGQITENLQRIRELAVQAANDSNDAKARTMVQAEIDDLVKAIGQIGSDTTFNTQKLLDGTFQSRTAQIGANDAETLSVSISDMGTSALGLTATTLGSLGITAGTVDLQQYIFSGAFGITSISVSTTDTLTDVFNRLNATTNAMRGPDYTVTGTIDASNVVSLSAPDFTTYIRVLGTSNFGAVTGLASGSSTGGGLGNPPYVLTASAALAAAGGSGLSVMSNADANQAIATVDAAMAKVSSERGKLGAVQNRLESNIRNLAVGLENMSAAESRMRDLDVADEMTDYARSSILSQSATSLVAQGNFSALSLMKLLA